MGPCSRRRAIAALIALAAVSGCAAAAAAIRPDPAAVPAERWGVEVQAPRRLAAGYLVEVRLRVLDAAKASPLFDPAAPARLVGESGGKALAPARGSGARGGPLGPDARPEPGRSYAVLFDNTLGALAAGERATFVLGPLELRELKIEEEGR